MGNTPSSSQVGRRPSHARSEEEIFHGSHRNPDRNRSRHCFVIRSQRPPRGVGVLDEETRCYCPQTTTTATTTSSPPAASTDLKPRQRCCCGSPPGTTRQRACCSSGNKTQRCFNCPGNESGGQGQRRVKACHPDAYPVPELLRTKQMCLHPLGARCDCEDRKVHYARTAAPTPGEPLPIPPERQVEVPYSDSGRSFEPAVQAINETCEDVHDVYYPRRPRSTRIPEVDPLANFDINRFDREATNQGPGGRRRNVSIRTCVDYDYEPEYPPRDRTYRASKAPPQHHPGYPPTQSSPGYLPPVYPPPPSTYPPPPSAYPPPPLSTYPPPPPSYVSPPAAYHPPSAEYAPRSQPPHQSSQRPYQHRTHPGSYDDGEIEYVKCPYK
ncbi:serine/arginine repetitive matrix protein 1 [Drosophila eugracilis]|uniref:serine/arginine repetitive matrix protein 1 n=1 Tax=Drosophila eugracilis TaxID=29029 RepID=UPI0007E6FCBA|nr:serine/arginine repetitive matrix protein 1 [Drosophila eugracilis]